ALDIDNYKLSIAMTFLARFAALPPSAPFTSTPSNSSPRPYGRAPYLASILTPFITKMALSYGLSTVDIIFGVSALIAGLLMLRFPETKHHKIPETLKESEAFGSASSDKAPLITD
ncbi:Solute carrier family 22 member 15like, partial [Caligus rogercresseyi]